MFFRYLRGSPKALFGTIFGTMGLLLLIVGGLLAVRMVSVTSDVVEVEGTVLEVVAPTNRRGAGVRVEWTGPDQQTHRKWISLQRRDWATKQMGQPMALWVSRIDPSEAWNAEGGVRPSHWNVAPIWGIGLVLMIAGFGFAASGIKRVNQRLRVLRGGQRVQGQVLALVENTKIKRNGQPYATVRYAWTTGGRTFEGESPSMRLDEARRFEPGGAIPVYVDPAQPQLGEADVYGFRG